MDLRTKEMVQHEFIQILKHSSLKQACLSVKVKDGCFDSWLMFVIYFLGLVAIKMKSCLNIKDGLSSISKSFHNFNFLFKSNNFNLHSEIYLWADFLGETKFGFISVIAQKIPINFCMKMRNMTLCKPACIFYVCEGNKYPVCKCVVCQCVFVCAFAHFPLQRA